MPGLAGPSTVFSYEAVAHYFAPPSACPVGRGLRGERPRRAAGDGSGRSGESVRLQVRSERHTVGVSAANLGGGEEEEAVTAVFLAHV